MPGIVKKELDFPYIVIIILFVSTLIKIPREVEKILGEKGSDEFFNFLTQVLENQKKDILETSDEKFNKSLLEFKAEVQKQFGEVQKQFGEVQKQFGEVRKEFGENHKEIAGLHGLISSQTRWILSVVLAAVVLIPALQKIFEKIWP